MVFQEETYRVLLVSASDRFDQAMRPLLPESQYFPVDRVTSCGQARRALLEAGYDLVIINAPLPDDFGMRLAIDQCLGTGAGVLLCVKSELYTGVSQKVTEYGVLTLAKPSPLGAVRQSLQILCATRARLKRMEARQASVEERMEEIRLVNRAKWLLIEHQGLTEEEAHRLLEKRSMDTRTGKGAVAREIIETYEKEKHSARF